MRRTPRLRLPEDLFAKLSDVEQRAIGLGGAARQWYRAVAMQRDRILSKDQSIPERWADAAFFAVALKQVLATAELARKLVTEDDSNADIRRAINAFNRAAPHVIKIRNTLHYLQDYQLNVGKEQQKARKSGLRYERTNFMPVIRYERTGKTVRCLIRIGENIELELGAATQAAETLAAEIHAATSKLLPGTYRASVDKPRS